MSLIVKLIISLVIAAVTAALAATVLSGIPLNLPLFLAFAIATTATAFITQLGSAKPASGTRATVSRASSASAASSAGAGDNRETGSVKWFNVSKGFGFITMDDGEEIFVHFRSIRGEGRRGLRDGQRVSFVVTESDKGPQAEDVVGED